MSHGLHMKGSTSLKQLSKSWKRLGLGNTFVIFITANISLLLAQHAMFASYQTLLILPVHCNFAFCILET